uniref:FBA domain-containing protein n=1 Tax=Sinocyclocheilus rhinocerous TaxID=307959 RepID=A0A673FW04_9TELE
KYLLLKWTLSFVTSQIFFMLKQQHYRLNKVEKEFSGWKIVQNGGDCWPVEDNLVEIPNCTVSKYFVTSYWPSLSPINFVLKLCLKQQLIDLISVEPEPVFFPQWNDQQWCEITRLYPFHSWWEGYTVLGWYGIRVTNSSVEICPAEER